MTLLLSSSCASLVESICNGTTFFNGCLGTNHLINLVHTRLQSFGTQIIMKWSSYEIWQKLSNNIPVYFAYYAGIMLDAFGYLLCFLLCRHNQPGPGVQLCKFI